MEVAWRELVRIDFFGAPEGATPRAVRLHGTVLDRRGNGYTGALTWGAAAAYTSDRLEGSEDGRERQIPFGQVALIERTAASSARLTLTGGERLTLSRDGASGNAAAWDAIPTASRASRGRSAASVAVGVIPGGGGVLVSDPRLGLVRLPWSEVRQVHLHEAERMAPGLLDGGSRLRGTVVTQDGERHTGYVRWDNDEEHGWEMLNGVSGRTSFAVELAHVLKIRRGTQRSSLVTLRDGRELELSGSNDVGWGNKGIVVEADDGTFHLVDWVRFRELVFEAEP